METLEKSEEKVRTGVESKLIRNIFIGLQESEVRDEKSKADQYKMSKSQH